MVGKHMGQSHYGRSLLYTAALTLHPHEIAIRLFYSEYVIFVIVTARLLGDRAR